MSFHLLSLSKYTFSSSSSHIITHFSSSPHLHCNTELGLSNSSRESETRFCNSPRRLFELPSRMNNHDGLVVVRCSHGGAHIENEVDGFYIRRCVEIARKAIGYTSPNPMVGCVIVKDGKVIGEGFHPKAGQPHAEVFALRAAGHLAENATAYVSLEPCNHYGRTPPCTEALIKAKVKKVVVGMVDPNPIVASKGVDRLRDAGIDVIVGVEEQLCKKLNEAYIHQMLTRKPYVTLRYSISVNGHLLDQLGDGVMESGGYYSRLLQEHDAVIFSPATSAEKLSLPSSNEAGANQPLRIIVLRSPSGPTATALELETAQNETDVVIVENVNWNDVVEHCKIRGLCSVLLDLRGDFGNLEELLNEGIEKKLLQKIVVEVLPVLDEGNEGNSLAAFKSLEKRIKVNNLHSRVSGQSVVLEGYL